MSTITAKNHCNSLRAMTSSHHCNSICSDDGHKVTMEKSRMQRYDDMRRSLLAASGWPAGKAERSRINRQAWAMSAKSTTASQNHEPVSISAKPRRAAINQKSITPLGTLSDGKIASIIGPASLDDSESGWLNLLVVSDRRRYRFGWNGERFSRCHDSNALTMRTLGDIRALLDAQCR